jgi:hypothetical protein
MTCSSDVTFILHSVTHLARARAFYEGLLELKPSAAYERGGRTRIEYDLNPGTLVITTSPGAARDRSAEKPAAEIPLGNFEAIVADLRDASVRFASEPPSRAACGCLVVADPDNNLVAIYPRAAA